MLETPLAFLFFVTGLMTQTKPVQDQINPVKELIDAARTDSPKLKELLEATDSFGRRVPEFAGRDGVAVWGQEFVFAVESTSPASVSIDNGPPIPMKRVSGTNYWYLWKMLRLGTTHRNQYMADGKNLGGRLVLPQSIQPGALAHRQFHGAAMASRGEPGRRLHCPGQSPPRTAEEPSRVDVDGSEDQEHVSGSWR